MNFWNTKLAQKISEMLVSVSSFFWKKTKSAAPVVQPKKAEPAPAKKAEAPKKPAAPRKPRTPKAKKEQ